MGQGALMGRIVGYLVGFSCLLMGILLGGELVLYVDYPSLVLTFGAGFGFCFAVHPPADVKAAFQAAMGTGEISPASFQRHDPVLETLTNTIIAGAFLGTLIASVNMLTHLDDPKSVGPAFAVALLTLFYAGIAAGAILLPLRSRLKRRLVGAGAVPKMPSAILPASFTLLMTVLLWAVLLSWTN